MARKVNFFFVLVIATLAASTMSISSAEPKFPFEVEFTGELVEGFFFQEISTNCDSDILTEVMVTNSDGAVVFPADLEFAFPFVKLLYAKISEKKERVGVRRCVEELVRVVTPRTTQQMMIYPYVEENLILEISQNFNLQPNRLRAIITGQNKKKLEKQKKLGKKVQLFAILSGRSVRQYQVMVDDFGDELVSMSLKTEDIIFHEPEKKGEPTSILPPK